MRPANVRERPTRASLAHGCGSDTRPAPAEFYLHAASNLGSVAQWARAGARQAADPGIDTAFVEAIFVPRDENCFVLYRAARVTAAGSLAWPVLRPDHQRDSHLRPRPMI